MKVAALALLVSCATAPVAASPTSTFTLSLPAQPSTTATRGTMVQETVTLPPPEQYAPAGLDACAEMSWYRQHVGLPARFDQIGWRESNCRNEDGVRTFCCFGWWQLHQAHFGSHESLFWTVCQVDSADDVNSDTPADKARQACATKVLFDRDGLKPWRTT